MISSQFGDQNNICTVVCQQIEQKVGIFDFCDGFGRCEVKVKNFPPVDIRYIQFWQVFPAIYAETLVPGEGTELKLTKRFRHMNQIGETVWKAADSRAIPVIDSLLLFVRFYLCNMFKQCRFLTF